MFANIFTGFFALFFGMIAFFGIVQSSRINKEKQLAHWVGVFIILLLATIFAILTSVN